MRPFTVIFTAVLGLGTHRVASLAQDAGQQAPELSTEIIRMGGDYYRLIDRAVEAYEARAIDDSGALAGLDQIGIGTREEMGADPLRRLYFEVWLFTLDRTKAGATPAPRASRFRYKYQPDGQVSASASFSQEKDLPLPSDLYAFYGTSFRAARAAVARYGTGPPDLCAVIIGVGVQRDRTYLVTLQPGQNMPCKARALLPFMIRYSVDPETFEVLKEAKD
jgi:hypothetical protein